MSSINGDGIVCTVQHPGTTHIAPESGHSVIACKRSPKLPPSVTYLNCLARKSWQSISSATTSPSSCTASPTYATRLVDRHEAHTKVIAPMDNPHTRTHCCATARQWPRLMIPEQHMPIFAPDHAHQSMRLYTVRMAIFLLAPSQVNDALGSKSTLYVSTICTKASSQRSILNRPNDGTEHDRCIFTCTINLQEIVTPSEPQARAQQCLTMLSIGLSSRSKL